MMYTRQYIKYLLAFLIGIAGTQLHAGPTYPDLMDTAIFNTYGGGGYFYQASCSVCHGNRPEIQGNATTDFASNFKFIGGNLLPARANLSNLTLSEMTTIVRGMAGYDPDSDGYTNEEEWGWNQEIRQFQNPSNPNDYFSNPTNAPPPGGSTGDVSKQAAGTTAGMPRMGGCGMAEGEVPSQDRAAGSAIWFILPLALAVWARRKP
jgi:hypothetical protein